MLLNETEFKGMGWQRRGRDGKAEVIMDDDLINSLREALEEWGYLCYYDDDGVERTLQKILEVLQEHDLLGD